jgi:uncharacterized SAM-dependent methyltransferase
MRPASVAVVSLILFLTSGCAAAILGVGAGVVISKEVTDNHVHVAHLADEPNRVWVFTKSTLSHLASEPIHVDEDLRQVSGKVDGYTVTIGVETYDQNRSLLKVGARRFGVPNAETAEMVLNRVLNRLQE